MQGFRESTALAHHTPKVRFRKKPPPAPPRPAGRASTLPLHDGFNLTALNKPKFKQWPLESLWKLINALMKSTTALFAPWLPGQSICRLACKKAARSPAPLASAQLSSPAIPPPMFITVKNPAARGQIYRGDCSFSLSARSRISHEGTGQGTMQTWRGRDVHGEAHEYESGEKLL